MTKALEEKIAIVTGSSGGIGSVICERLSAEGAAVVVHYSGHEATAKQVVQNIELHNSKAITMQADLSQSQQVTALFNRTEQQFGAPDILVNLAGVRYIGAIADMDDDAFDRMFDLNAKGAFFCMREAARRLNDNGRIVNISRVLSIELGSRGITVNSVSPGPTATDEFKTSVDESKAAAAARSPFNRIGQPDDIANVVAFVVSDQCRWITGHTFQASGGYV
jgi:3-oxoacyl-[acyl-carrier protein] reductase